LVSQAKKAISKRQVLGALRYREFRKYFYSTMWQSSGLGMQFLIIGWLVLELTDSSSQLGLVIFLYGVPNLILLPIAGIAADRMDRRLLLIVSRTAVGLIIAVLATLTTMNLVVMWHLYLAATILGAIQGFNMPAGMALVADLVERDDMLNAT
jgi:MFS family permease